MNCFIPAIYFHLPYFIAASSTEHDFFLSLSNNFLPLLNVIENLEHDKVDYALTIIISPTYLRALNDQEILSRYHDWLNTQLSTTTDNKKLNHYKNLLFWLTEKYQFSLCDALLRLASYQHLEIITTSATNAMLSLLNANLTAINAQIGIGLNYFEKLLNEKSTGLFLPFGAFTPPVLPILENQHIGFIIIEGENERLKNTALITSPMLMNNNIVGFITNENFSAMMLGAENTDADQHANKYLAQLTNLPPNNQAITTIYNTNQQQNLNFYQFLDLLLRKLCYDQKVIAMIKPSDYLSKNNDLLQLSKPDFLNNDLTNLYQNNYENPDLTIAVLQLSKLKSQNYPRELLTQLAQELLLAQSNEINNQQHLINFAQILNKQPNPNDKIMFTNVDLLSFY